MRGGSCQRVSRRSGRCAILGPSLGPAMCRTLYAESRSVPAARCSPPPAMGQQSGGVAPKACRLLCRARAARAASSGRTRDRCEIWVRWAFLLVGHSGHLELRHSAILGLTPRLPVLALLGLTARQHRPHCWANPPAWRCFPQQPMRLTRRKLRSALGCLTHIGLLLQEVVLTPGELK